MRRFWSPSWLLLLAVVGVCGAPGATRLEPTTTPTAAPTHTPVPTVTPTPSSRKGVVQIAIGDLYVHPQVITITVGTTVEWVPYGNLEHTIIGEGDQSGWPGDGTVSFTGSRPFRATFRAPGVYPYYCDHHLGAMDGVVVVVEADEPINFNAIRDQ